jgi:hypothetical protein
MDAVGIQRAAQFGISEGGSPAAIFAATHPERTDSLILYGAFARFSHWIPTDEGFDGFIGYIDEHWGSGASLSNFAPSKAEEPDLQKWWGKFERLGARIRERGLSTTVPDGATCTSACGFIWLAGTSRFLEGNGRVGFHAVFVAGRRKPISGPGNARVGAYMARLGFSDPAIAYATEAGPGDMMWLTPSKAASVEIAVTWKKKGLSRAQIEDTGEPIASVDATWNIQLGFYPTKKAAQDALYAARGASPKLFANKQAFTVEVKKGDEAVFRARMSGFTANTAKRGCRTLSRKGLDCSTLAPQS